MSQAEIRALLKRVSPRKMSSKEIAHELGANYDSTLCKTKRLRDSGWVNAEKVHIRTPISSYNQWFHWHKE